MTKIKISGLVILSFLLLSACSTETPKKETSDETYVFNLIDEIDLKKEKESQSIATFTKKSGEPLFINKFPERRHARWLIKKNKQKIAVFDISYQNDLPDQVTMTLVKEKPDFLSKEKQLNQNKKIKIGNRLNQQDILSLLGNPYEIRKIKTNDHTSEKITTFYDFSNKDNQEPTLTIQTVNDKVISKTD